MYSNFSIPTLVVFSTVKISQIQPTKQSFMTDLILKSQGLGADTSTDAEHGDVETTTRVH